MATIPSAKGQRLGHLCKLNRPRIYPQMYPQIHPQRFRLTTALLLQTCRQSLGWRQS